MRRSPKLILSAVSLASLSGVLGGCANFPELDRAVTPQGLAAPPPELSPIGELVVPAAASRGGVEELQDAAADLRSRAEASRSRSEALAEQTTQDADARAALDARRKVLAQTRDASP